MPRDSATHAEFAGGGVSVNVCALFQLQRGECRRRRRHGLLPGSTLFIVLRLGLIAVSGNEYQSCINLCERFVRVLSQVRGALMRLLCR